MKEISTFQTLRSCPHLLRFRARRGTQQSGDRGFTSAVTFKFLGKLETHPESSEKAEVVMYRLLLQRGQSGGFEHPVPPAWE